MQLLDLALAALRGLHRIHHDRRAVMENTLVAQSLEQLHAEQDKDQGKPNSFWQTTVQGIVNFLTSRAQKEEEEADSESKPDDNPKNSKSDTAIHEYTKVGQSTTLNVLRPMLFSFARLLQAQQPHRRNPVRQELDSPCPNIVERLRNALSSSWTLHSNKIPPLPFWMPRKPKKSSSSSVWVVP